jgi:hypothetical protein
MCCCCVTSPRMCQLRRHKENTAPVLLAMSVLRTLPSNGFTCHNMFALHLPLPYSEIQLNCAGPLSLAASPGLTLPIIPQLFCTGNAILETSCHHQCRLDISRQSRSWCVCSCMHEVSRKRGMQQYCITVWMTLSWYIFPFEVTRHRFCIGNWIYWTHNMQLQVIMAISLTYTLCSSLRNTLSLKCHH